jgi:hypothetical protein
MNLRWTARGSSAVITPLLATIGVRRESPRHAARTAGRGPSGYRRPHRGGQVRHHVCLPGALDRRNASRCAGRSRRFPRAPPASHRRLERRIDFRALAGECARARQHACDGGYGSADRLPRDRSHRRGDRRPGPRHTPRLERNQARQAHRDGQRRGGCACRSPARAQGEERRRGLQPRLGRPARAHLRAGRLGAHLRLQGGRRRQGHALRAALSPLHARYRVGHSRQISVDHRPRFDQSEDSASSMGPNRASR